MGSHQDPGLPSRPQAYEERQRHWQREREALREDGATQAQAQRAQRAQQLLQLQVFQLQQEKRQLQDDFAQLLQEREQLERRCATFEREQRELGPRLEETKWEVGRTKGAGRPLGQTWTEGPSHTPSACHPKAPHFLPFVRRGSPLTSLSGCGAPQASTLGGFIGLVSAHVASDVPVHCLPTDNKNENVVLTPDGPCSKRVT